MRAQIYSFILNDLEDYVIKNMTNIVIEYRNIHFSLPIRRVASRIHWLCSIKRLIGLILSLKPSNAKILDAGCGIGHLSALLSMLGKDVVSIDINPDKSLWRYMGKKYKIQFICADARYIPLREKTFNVVLAYAVLEHLGNQVDEQQFLSEVYRTLKKEGKIVLGGTPNKYSFTEIFGESAPILGGHKRKFTKGSLISKLESSQFFTIFIENEYFLPQYLPMDLLNKVWNQLAFPLVKIDSYLRSIPFHHSFFVISEKSDPNARAERCSS
jgi:ubiquinone/menaquinone biosynthesis C-methylase UbiE